MRGRQYFEEKIGNFYDKKRGISILEKKLVIFTIRGERHQYFIEKNGNFSDNGRKASVF